MRLLAVSINGLLDLKNFLPLALETMSKHSIGVDVVHFRTTLSDFVDSYDGVIVGSDWNQNGALVDAFKAAGKRTILLQSEGMFLEEHEWYVGKAPRTDIACVWGPEHARIFRSRGYAGHIVVVGPPRFDLYNNFKPVLTKEQVYMTLGLEVTDKPIILYLGQFFPKHEFGEALYDTQIALTKFAAQTPQSFYGLIKCHPQETASHYFSRSDLIAENKPSTVRVVDRGGHTEAVDVSTLIYHSAAVVTYSSTAAIEAMFLGRPAGIFETDQPSPLGNGKFASLPVLKAPEDVVELATRPVDMSACQTFIDRFLPGQFTGAFTAAAASAIANFIRSSPPPPRKERAKLPSAVNPEPESDQKAPASDANSRKLCARAYTRLADILGKTTPLHSIEPARPFLIPPKSTIRNDRAFLQSLHDENAGYQTNNWLLPELLALRLSGAKTIVEVGCGNGRFLRAASEFAERVIGLDTAKSPLLVNLPANVAFRQLDIVESAPPEGDLVCSADVLEQIPADDILEVLRKLHEAGPRQYHLIACYDDGHSHQTIADPGLWLALFRTLSPKYALRDVRARRDNPDQPICIIANW